MPPSELKKLMNKVRKLPEYLEWKQWILEQSYVPGSIPKGIQIHHSEHNFSWYFKEYNISTIEEARKCKALWCAKGICLTRGEHFAITRISLYKYPTSGFIQLLAEQLERLQEAQFNERPTKAGRKNLLETREYISHSSKRKATAKRDAKIRSGKTIRR